VSEVSAAAWRLQLLDDATRILSVLHNVALIFVGKSVYLAVQFSMLESDMRLFELKTKARMAMKPKQSRERAIGERVRWVFSGASCSLRLVELFVDEKFIVWLRRLRLFLRRGGRGKAAPALQLRSSAVHRTLNSSSSLSISGWEKRDLFRSS